MPFNSFQSTSSYQEGEGTTENETGGAIERPRNTGPACFFKVTYTSVQSLRKIDLLKPQNFCIEDFFRNFDPFYIFYRPDCFYTLCILCSAASFKVKQNNLVRKSKHQEIFQKKKICTFMNTQNKGYNLCSRPFIKVDSRTTLVIQIKSSNFQPWE